MAIGVPNEVEAGMVVNLLAVEGIPAMIRRSPGGPRPADMQIGGPHQVLVRHGDLVAARAILGLDDPA